MMKNNRLYAVGITIVIILGIITFLTSNKKEESVDYSNMTDEEIEVAVKEEVNEITVNKLADLGERDRMEYYVGTFIKAVGNKDYETAYEMLYDDFKNTYFDTYSKFEEYAKSKFSSSVSVEYTNLERNGDVYILWVTLSDILKAGDTGEEMNFVVQENGLNDFKLSFSVN